jgi:hypothetical protein
MSLLHRVVLSGLVAAGCGKRDSSPEQRSAPTVHVDAQSADAAPAAATLDVPFQLPTAQHASPLPAAPGAYVFVTAQGALRAGTSPSFAAATEATDVDSLRKLIPRGPDSTGILDDLKPSDIPPLGTGRYGTLPPLPGTGQGYGVGAGGGGTYVAHSLTAFHADPARAHVLVVADRAASMNAIAELVKDSFDLYAIAVAGDDGRPGALPLVISIQSGGGAAQYQIFMSGFGAQVLNNNDGTTYTTPAAPNGLLDRAALNQHLAGVFAAPAGADAWVGVYVDARAPLSDLVGALDATTPGKRPVAITVRGRVPGMRGRNSASIPQIRIGQPSAVGNLDKAIVRRYIKRNIQKLLYCYEKQLLVKPALQGTVSTQFVIKPDGTVSSSKASGVSPDVSSCIADVIHAIEFPKPKGGGVVQVSFPFTFRPTGD